MPYTVKILKDEQLVVLHTGIEPESTARNKARLSVEQKKTSFASVISEDSGGEIWSARLNEDGSISTEGLTGD
jgi:hypothetical protein